MDSTAPVICDIQEDLKELQRKRAHVTDDKPLYDVNGYPYWELGGKTRRVTLTTWKGQRLIDLREYYEDSVTHEMRPGKKGLSLTPKQLTAFINVLPCIETLLKKNPNI
ncbi:hypothetical protein PCANB_003052 [Pneumocystis canis]|nr:hypothetical protein PCK1_003022 [Pneumocystis canis]KAG5438201.1 hypothetical protein PCANB_003052 [Pneumocystis canis]